MSLGSRASQARRGRFLAFRQKRGGITPGTFVMLGRSAIRAPVIKWRRESSC